MVDDLKTGIAGLRDVVRQFVQERDWKQFHSPKNLSMALAVEAAELMEHFQWISQDESRELDAEKQIEVGEEMSDVFCYLLALANELEIDLSSAFHRKMALNRKKYPAAEFRGRFGPNDPKSVSLG